MKNFLTIPTNTASCERSFSALRRLKTYLRVTMTQERLSNLTVLYIHNEYKIDFEKIIDRFDVEASIKGRSTFSTQVNSFEFEYCFIICC